MATSETATEFGEVAALAEAALSYAAGRKPEQPEWWMAKLLAGTPNATAGAIERAIRTRNAERETRLDVEKVAVNLRGWQVDGLVFMIEGIRLKERQAWPTQSST